MRQSIERASQASKKPRVPKVAELMPDAIIIKPTESVKSSIEVGSGSPDGPVRHSKSNVHSPPKVNKSKYEIFQTPSMVNIGKFSVTEGQTIKSHRSKGTEQNSQSPALQNRMSKKMFSIVNPAGRRIANFKKKSSHKKQAVSKDILLHESSP